ncbi:MAG: hypothetical protein PHI41_04215 [Erysipelotrichaceae bacterium]|nr:hypothetical protein [Erysipelotrichaceae bacterium]MDD3810377.1 hypothetical protein [Erysipelotrichaceae bacterium]
MDRLVYLDNAATKRLSSDVFCGEGIFFFEEYANVASVSSFSLKARLAVYKADPESPIG